MLAKTNGERRKFIQEMYDLMHKNHEEFLVFQAETAVTLKGIEKELANIACKLDVSFKEQDGIKQKVTRLITLSSIAGGAVALLGRYILDKIFNM